MRRYFGWALALVISSGFSGLGGAMAADMAVKARPAPPLAAVYNWTGFYIGANAGYSWSNADVTSYTIGGIPVLLPPDVTHHRLDGFIGGGQLGYNWQVGQYVFGIEGDAAWRDAKKSTVFGFPGGVDFTTFTTRENWFATIRPRAGFAADNFLFYVTGGAAFDGREHTFVENRPSLPGANRTITSDDTRVGWTVGVGVEAGFGQWSVGLEYLYADFGRHTTLSAPTQTLGGLTFLPSQVTFDDSTQNIVRAKLNYHFNGPVVARY
jgi:outer membrane immunogenic protein